MTDRFRSIPLKEPSSLARIIATRHDIFYNSILNETEFERLARDLHLHLGFKQDLQLLWKLGLLRADLIKSSRKIRLVGLKPIGLSWDGQYEYSDERYIRNRKGGLINISEKQYTVPSWVTLMFHPYRIYILSEMESFLGIKIHPLQAVVGMKYFQKTSKRRIEQIQHITCKPKFYKLVERLNNITALSIASEPWVYANTFGAMHLPADADQDTQRRRIEDHWADLKTCYVEIGQQELDSCCEDICFAAFQKDPNRQLHTTIRLTRPQKQHRLMGRLGACIRLLEIAEVLRRGTEDALSVQLKEEDERIASMSTEGFKKKLYGDDRLLDSTRSVKSEYIRQFGLDYRVRVRWYIEGDTEFFGLEKVIAEWGAVELINLKGSFVEKRGKGVAFRESLRRDKKDSVFSFVLLDADVKDNLRVVKLAARAGEITGGFFISEPDFEFENFTLIELGRIIGEMVKDRGIKPELIMSALDRMPKVRSKSELFTGLREEIPELGDIEGGKEWGSALIDYALENREMKTGVENHSQVRPIVKAIEIVVRAVQADFRRTLLEYKVDEETGLPQPR
jgi:hypothetical protein